MSSFLGPYWVQLNYTSNAHEHRALLPCAVGGSAVPGVEPELTRRVGADQLAGAAVAAYCNAAKGFLKTTDSFDSFYVFRQPTPSDPPTLLWADDLAIAGTSSGATAPASEIVLSFKTPAPGGLKLYLMEGVTILNYRAPLTTGSGSPEQVITTFILGNDDWIIGRNGQFPLLGLFVTTKLNDHLRRKYLLQ